MDGLHCGDCEYFDLEEGETICILGGGYCEEDDDACDQFEVSVDAEDYDDGTD